MSIQIENISVQNLGPHNRLALDLKRFNLIYGHNEYGKTYLVEYLISALFKNSRQWRLRSHSGRGTVTVAGLDKKPVRFTPSSNIRLEDFLAENHPGLPADFSKLLVVKGAELELANVDGGIDKTIVRGFLSNKQVLDQVENNISKTLQKATFENGVLKGDSRGEIGEYNRLEDVLKGPKGLIKLLEQVDKGYSDGERSTLAAQIKALTVEKEQLELAKRHWAWLINQEVVSLTSHQARLPKESVVKLKSEFEQFRQDISEIEQKQHLQKHSQESSRGYEWLKQARDLYHNLLERVIEPPSKILGVLAAFLVLLPIPLSFFTRPEYAVIPLLPAVLLGWLQIRKVQLFAQHQSVNEEMTRLHEQFQAYFSQPLTGLPDIENKLLELEKDYNNAAFLKEQIESDQLKIEKERSHLSVKIKTLVGENREEAAWQNCLDTLESEAGKIAIQLQSKREQLAMLNVDSSDFLEEAPGLEYSRQAYDTVLEELKNKERDLEEEKQKLVILKQRICQTTGDDIAAAWETVISNLRSGHARALAAFQDKTAEALGKIAVMQVLKLLRRDEDSKIESGLASPEVQAPLFELTRRYEHIALEGERLFVSDKFDSFPLSDLSTGAQEQILLGLRIGFSSKLLQGEPLFLILDDAFQYSDWERRKLLVNRVAELARRGWQIVYFTMDDNIRTLFDKAGKQFGEAYFRCDLKEMSLSLQEPSSVN